MSQALNIRKEIVQKLVDFIIYEITLICNSCQSSIDIQSSELVCNIPDSGVVRKAIVDTGGKLWFEDVPTDKRFDESALTLEELYKISESVERKFRLQCHME